MNTTPQRVGLPAHDARSLAKSITELDARPVPTAVTMATMPVGTVIVEPGEALLLRTHRAGQLCWAQSRIADSRLTESAVIELVDLLDGAPASIGLVPLGDNADGSYTPAAEAVIFALSDCCPDGRFACINPSPRLWRQGPISILLDAVAEDTLITVRGNGVPVAALMHRWGEWVNTARPSRIFDDAETAAYVEARRCEVVIPQG